jgi:hypothetical protein
MDWIGMIFLLAGTVLLAYKLRVGWLANIIGSLSMLLYCWFIVYNLPLIILQLVFIFMSAFGYKNWKSNI